MHHTEANKRSQTLQVIARQEQRQIRAVGTNASLCAAELPNKDSPTSLSPAHPNKPADTLRTLIRYHGWTQRKLRVYLIPSKAYTSIFPAVPHAKKSHAPKHICFNNEAAGTFSQWWDLI